MPLYVGAIVTVKTSALIALPGGTIADNDKLVILDVSDTSQGAGGSLRSTSTAELRNRGDGLRVAMAARSFFGGFS